jgi:hypothetical protein
VPENQGGDETRGLPAKGGADLDARPRIEHRVERVTPEDRRRLRARETNEGELEAEPPEARAQRQRKRLMIASVVGAFLLVGAVGLGWYWHTIWRWLLSLLVVYCQVPLTVLEEPVLFYKLILLPRGRLVFAPRIPLVIDELTPIDQSLGMLICTVV